MKTTLLLLASCASVFAQDMCDLKPRTAGAVTVSCYKVPAALLAQLGIPTAKAPDSVHVWVKSSDESVTAFRVLLRYELNGEAQSSTVLTARGEIGTAVAVLAVSGPAANTKVLSVTVEELRSAGTVELH
jgi:hypothetical protein